MFEVVPAVIAWPGRRARLARAAAAALMLVAAVTAVPARAVAGAVAVVDDRGVTVRLASSPRRVVALMPSLTETVCALGACDRLVAVDRFSNYPASVRALPRLGGLGDVDIERIVAARPDLVLVPRSARVADRLEALGLTVAAFEAWTIGDVRRVLGDVSRLLGTGDPDRVWQAIGAQIDAAARAVPAGARGLRVYVEIDDGGYAAGQSSYIGQLLDRLGLRDIVPASLGPYPRLNPEFIVRADPQLILVTRGNPRETLTRPGWQGIDAVRSGRVCRFGPDDRDVLTRPGPRLGEAAWIVTRCLNSVVRR